MFNRYSPGDMVRLQFNCPEHGLFSDVVPSSRVAAAPGPQLTHGCTSSVNPRFMPFTGRCTRPAAWVRSTEDDDPGDEDRG